MGWYIHSPKITVINHFLTKLNTIATQLVISLMLALFLITYFFTSFDNFYGGGVGGGWVVIEFWNIHMSFRGGVGGSQYSLQIITPIKIITMSQHFMQFYFNLCPTNLLNRGWVTRKRGGDYMGVNIKGFLKTNGIWNRRKCRNEKDLWNKVLLTLKNNMTPKK